MPMRLRKRLSVLLAVLVPVISLVVFGGSTPALAVSNGPFQVINYNSSLCLDVAHASRASGTPIIQYGCHHGANQLWYFEISDTAGAVGHFMMVPSHTASFIPQGCLTVPGWPPTNGTAAVLTDCEYVNLLMQQNWSLVPTGGSALPTPGAQYRYRFYNQFTSMCLEVRGGSSSQGAVIQEAVCNGSLQQYWIVVP